MSRFNNEISNSKYLGDVSPDFIKQLSILISLIVDNRKTFEDNCEYNISHVGKKFKSDIENYLSSLSAIDAVEVLGDIFVCSYRFLCEADLRMGLQENFDVSGIHRFVDENLIHFSPRMKRQLIYASHLMPARMAHEMLSSPGLEGFKNFSSTIDKAEKLKKTWDDEFEQKRLLIDGLSENIKNLTSEYNFVGLVDGFRALRSEKVVELRGAFTALMLLGVAMIVLPAAQILMVLANLEYLDAHKSVLMYFIPSIVAIELMILYFFRVVLVQYKSVKAQILQLDLRISLCQFIESYSDYASKIRSQGADVLGKFESLIFSGLVLDGTDIPSTFDGIDQLAALIKGVRG
ncbi:hypothetical protein [Stenotrophomonas sp. PFBMAA-4]|uniref:hypothetical protein n=1 Tax=Stenotrophomonas sp. PFBMAA-4 TaxID=3043301 RepID=UPI0024B5374D|nr:hypothetical protein [Stenotrophomonas sp. PFBMAA-4]MDI9272497.1 hypothetical protein [Stenotrophomonas sp. PFBMAA-4]